MWQNKIWKLFIYLSTAGFPSSIIIFENATAAEYPVDVLEEIANKGLKVEAMDALSLAVEAGSSKAVNIVLMGKASKHFDIPYESWIKAIENTVAERFVEMNKKAFELGYNA